MLFVKGNLSSEAPLAAPEDSGGVVAQELEWRDPVTVTFSSHR